MQDDHKIIEEVLAGNADAFEGIVLRYQDNVATIIRNMIPDEDIATDIGQEVFIRLYRSLDKFKGNSSLSTYIGRIAINLSLNEIKRQKRRKRLPVDQVTGLEDEHAGKSVVQMENRDLIAKAMAGLIPKYRSVVVLRMIEGYSTAETSEMLSIPTGTVLSRLARAQDKLKQELNKLGYVHGEK